MRQSRHRDRQTEMQSGRAIMRERQTERQTYIDREEERDMQTATDRQSMQGKRGRQTDILAARQRSKEER